MAESSVPGDWTDPGISEPNEDGSVSWRPTPSSASVPGAGEDLTADEAIKRIRIESGGAVGEREEPLEQARDALLSVLTVCGLEGQDPPDTLLAFQMIRDFARPAYDALVEAENADD